MTALYIIIGIVALPVLLLLLPCGIALTYREDAFTATLHYLWLRFPLLPTPQKGKPAKTKKGEKTTPKKAKKKRPFLDYLGLFNDLLPQLRNTLRRTIGKISLARCRVTLTVAQEDAADTAIRYGYAQALVHNLYGFLANHIRVREYRVQVLQDYIHGPTAEQAEADLLFRLSLLTLLTAGVRLLWHGGRLYLRLPALK